MVAETISESVWFSVTVSDWSQLPVEIRFGLCIALTLAMLENFEAYQIAKKFYWACKLLKVPRFLQDQLLRASSSVVLNLAEASGKRTPQDQRRFFSIAFGSLRECRAILEMETISDPETNRLADQLSAILYTLSRKQLPAATVTENQTDSDTDSATNAPKKI